MTTDLTLAELNAAQAAWMALDPAAPRAEVDRVLALYNRRPKAHLVIPARFPERANVHSGGPVWAEAQPMDYAIAWARERGIQTRFAWRTDGVWVELPA